MLPINFVLVYGTKKFVLENFNRVREIGLDFILRSCPYVKKKKSIFE